MSSLADIPYAPQASLSTLTASTTHRDVGDAAAAAAASLRDRRGREDEVGFYDSPGSSQPRQQPRQQKSVSPPQAGTAPSTSDDPKAKLRDLFRQRLAAPSRPVARQGSAAKGTAPRSVSEVETPAPHRGLHGALSVQRSVGSSRSHSAASPNPAQYALTGIAPEEVVYKAVKSKVRVAISSGRQQHYFPPRDSATGGLKSYVDEHLTSSADRVAQIQHLAETSPTKVVVECPPEGRRPIHPLKKPLFVPMKARAPLAKERGSVGSGVRPAPRSASAGGPQSRPQYYDAADLLQQPRSARKGGPPSAGPTRHPAGATAGRTAAHPGPGPVISERLLQLSRPRSVAQPPRPAQRVYRNTFSPRAMTESMRRAGYYDDAEQLQPFRMDQSDQPLPARPVETGTGTQERRITLDEYRAMARAAPQPVPQPAPAAHPPPHGLSQADVVSLHPQAATPGGRALEEPAVSAIRPPLAPQPRSLDSTPAVPWNAPDQSSIDDGSDAAPASSIGVVLEADGAPTADSPPPVSLHTVVAASAPVAAETDLSPMTDNGEAPPAHIVSPLGFPQHRPAPIVLQRSPSNGSTASTAPRDAARDAPSESPPGSGFRYSTKGSAAASMAIATRGASVPLSSALTTQDPTPAHSRSGSTMAWNPPQPQPHPSQAFRPPQPADHPRDGALSGSLRSDTFRPDAPLSSLQSANSVGNYLDPTPRPAAEMPDRRPGEFAAPAAAAHRRPASIPAASNAPGRRDLFQGFGTSDAAPSAAVSQAQQNATREMLLKMTGRAPPEPDYRI